MFIERLLNQNQYYLEFMNTGISNFADDSLKEEFTDVIRLNFKAYKLYLSGRYNESYKLIEQFRRDIIPVYHKTFYNIYERDTLYLLEEHSAEIVSQQDARAIKLLKLGYRDLKVARIKANKAANYQKNLYAIRIEFYIEAIKYSRQSKRYAFLALMENNTPMNEKDDFQLQTIEEGLKGKPEIEDLTLYEKQNGKLVFMLNRRLFPNTYDYLVHLADAYATLGPGHRNYLTNLSPEDFNKEVNEPSK